MQQLLYGVQAADPAAHSAENGAIFDKFSCCHMPSCMPYGSAGLIKMYARLGRRSAQVIECWGIVAAVSRILLVEL